MTALALAVAELKRVTRDRTFAFFIILLPILVILLVGVTTAGSSNISIGLVPGQSTPLATQLANDLQADPALTTVRFSTRAQGVERFAVVSCRPWWSSRRHSTPIFSPVVPRRFRSSSRVPSRTTRRR